MTLTCLRHATDVSAACAWPRCLRVSCVLPCGLRAVRCCMPRHMGALPYTVPVPRHTSRVPRARTAHGQKLSSRDTRGLCPARQPPLASRLRSPSPPRSAPAPLLISHVTRVSTDLTGTAAVARATPPLPVAQPGVAGRGGAGWGLRAAEGPREAAAPGGVSLRVGTGATAIGRTGSRGPHSVPWLCWQLPEMLRVPRTRGLGLGRRPEDGRDPGTPPPPPDGPSPGLLPAVFQARPLPRPAAPTVPAAAAPWLGSAPSSVTAARAAPGVPALPLGLRSPRPRSSSPRHPPGPPQALAGLGWALLTVRLRGKSRGPVSPGRASRSCPGAPGARTAGGESRAGSARLSGT